MNQALHEAIADHAARTAAAVHEAEDRACFVALLLTDAAYVDSLQLVYVDGHRFDFEVVDSDPSSNDVTLVSTAVAGAPACAWPYTPTTEEQP